MTAKTRLLDAVRAKTVVLTVTAGRTGTKFLQQLLSIIPDVVSVHEGEPNYVHALRRAQINPEIAIRFLLEQKLPHIAACEAAAYVETSHLFCKGFLEPMLNLGICPDIVLLRRPPRKIARSLMERGTIPARTQIGHMYLLSPDDPNTLPLRYWQLMSDYQLCFWYALEIERRQKRYRSFVENRGGTVVDVTADELHDPRAFLAMVERLGLRIDDIDRIRQGHSELRGTIFNENPRKKTIDIDFDYAEEPVWEAVAFYEPLLREEIAARYRLASPRTREAESALTG